MAVTPDHVVAAAAAARVALDPLLDRDWSVSAGDVTWSVWDTGVHVADDQVFYATQLIAQPQDGESYVPFEVKMWDDDVDNDGLLRSIEACAAILARVVSTAQPQDRGYHVFGSSDAEGFAAMGVVETLIHTHDMVAGLGLAWTPPAELSVVVLERLFPEAPPGDPADVLLWCTGRTVLGDRDRRSEWRWDGSVRVG